MIASNFSKFEVSSTAGPAYKDLEIADAIARVNHPLWVVQDRARRRMGLLVEDRPVDPPPDIDLLWKLPSLEPKYLGDLSFLRAHGVRFPYIAGEMATGIATPEMVIAMARAGMLGFFGAGGLALPAIQAGIDHISAQLQATSLPWGVNLIHNIQDAGAEDAVVDLLLRNRVRRVCASAYLQLTPAVIRYACSGLHLDSGGQIVRKNQLFGKVSRPEIAKHFASPAPAAVLKALVEHGQLTASEAELASHVPLAQDITVEADSGGHTDNRPLVALFPTIVQAVREVHALHCYSTPIRIGAAGGLGTPQSIAAAFSLGAAYVVTGSVNQSAIESGLSPAGRALLAQAGIEDMAMAPAADMFELGVKVQVLKRGTMFSVRALRLFEVYRKYPSLNAIPAPDRQRLESEIFRAPLNEIWQETQTFFRERNSSEIERAQKEPKYLMALVFRWYLGQASRWAKEGTPDRVHDYQIWCGPAMGAFNAWTRGTFLADPDQRTVVQIAYNLLKGAAVVTRAQQLRTSGFPVPNIAFNFKPQHFG